MVKSTSRNSLGMNMESTWRDKGHGLDLGMVQLGSGWVCHLEWLGADITSRKKGGRPGKTGWTQGTSVKLQEANTV